MGGWQYLTKKGHCNSSFESVNVKSHFSLFCAFRLDCLVLIRGFVIANEVYKQKILQIEAITQQFFSFVIFSSKNRNCCTAIV